MPYTAPLTGIRSLSVAPNGDVMVCHFAIGNICSEDIEDILSRYDPNENPYMRAIMNRGVQGLADMAADLGMDADVSEFLSPCDACKALTQAMIGASRQG